MSVEIQKDEQKMLEKKGIIGLRSILFKEESMLITDLDDTIKEAHKYNWSDGKERKLLPETAIALKAIHRAGIKLGIATEQAFSQIEPFISDISQLTTGSSNPYELFSGLIVGEGGSVVNSKDRGQVVLASKRAIKDKERVVDWLWSNVSPSEFEGWSILSGTNPNESTYVQLPPREDVCVATASLWERGPHIGEKPEYIEKYHVIELAVKRAIEELGINTLTTFEAGNGTLRIVPTYINKAHTLGLLAACGVLELDKTVYSCDGPNDVRLAEKLKIKSGGVIAVGNAVTRLHQISDYSATLSSGSGFAEVISKIFPDEYLKAENELSGYKFS